MSENKQITWVEAAKVFAPIAGFFVVVFIVMALGGEAEPAKPAQNALDGLYGAFRPWLVPSLITLLIVAFLPILARHSARTQDTPREGSRLMVERDEWKKLATDAQDQNASLQALNVVLIDERNEWMSKALNKDRRIKELERAEAMHHQAMLNQRAELEQARTQIPLGVQQAAAIIDMIATERIVAVRKVVPFLRELGIPVTNAGYVELSAAVRRLRAPSPTEQASPVRDAATGTKPANARRERANGRTRTHPRTRKA